MVSDIVYNVCDSLANDPAAKSSPVDFDLSRIKSLRTLEFQARSIINRLKPLAPDHATLGFFRVVLSTIKSPAFSKVVVVYSDTDFYGVSTPPACGGNRHRSTTPDERAEEALWHCWLFEVFREMYLVRDFQLVLRAEVHDPVGEYMIGVLKQAIAEEVVAKRLDYLPSEPLVVYSPRGTWMEPWKNHCYE